MAENQENWFEQLTLDNIPIPSPDTFALLLLDDANLDPQLNFQSPHSSDTWNFSDAPNPGGIGFEGVANGYSAPSSAEGYSTLSDPLSNHSQQSSGLPQGIVDSPTFNTHDEDRLKIIAQPFYPSKLRYRSDYRANQNRVGTMKNRNKNSSYQGPAIGIPQKYLQPDKGFFVLVTLVTAPHPITNHRYIHPYELEHVADSKFNDTENNSVWSEIQSEDCTGVKSFPSLRIVKRTHPELKQIKSLKVFNHYAEVPPGPQDEADLTQLSSAGKIIEEYNLKHTYLAFTILEPVFCEGQITGHTPVPQSTVFSQAMIDNEGEQTTSEQLSLSAAASVDDTISNCHIQQYAPHYGFKSGGEEMIIILTSKLDQKKAGGRGLTAVFQWSSDGMTWNQDITSLTKNDRIISFTVPQFPYDITAEIRVTVTLRQSNRSLGEFQYFYLPINASCNRCLFNNLRQHSVVPDVGPNKRLYSEAFGAGAQCDGVVLKSESIQSITDSLAKTRIEDHCSVAPSEAVRSHSNRELVANATKPQGSSVSIERSKSNEASSYEEQVKDVLNKLSEMTEALFGRGDEKPLLRICRPFIKKQPGILHRALETGHDDILMKFLPLAPLEVLHHRDQQNGTLLFHALRLNRVDTVKEILNNRFFLNIVTDTDADGNNLFHLFVAQQNGTELLDLVLTKLSNTEFPIQEKLDRCNGQGYTPLQLAIRHNNLAAVQRFIKCFRTDTCYHQDHSQDNLLHLAVRHGDLSLVKYLIEEAHLSELGEESNLTMTPVKLAESLGKEDAIDYFRHCYPHHFLVHENESDESDSDNTDLGDGHGDDS